MDHHGMIGPPINETDFMRLVMKKFTRFFNWITFLKMTGAVLLWIATAWALFGLIKR